MESHKEIKGACLIRFFLCALLLNLPTSTCLATIYASLADKNPNSDDSLQVSKPGFLPETRDIIPGPIGPIVPIEPNDSIAHLIPHDIEFTVGKIDGAFSVNNSGAAVYSMTFDAPNGGSLTPRVGLAYNSLYNGYGLAGYGFNITGISAITRGGHDMFHDGRLAGVTYTSSDNFFIDGKRLILQSGISGQDGARYTVEGDPFTKVVVHGNNNKYEATTWFEVTDNTGMTYEYGNSANSKVTYRNNCGNPRIASWYVSRATDKYSNYITYEYAISNLSIRPTTITYGMNSLKSRGVVNRICFDYLTLAEKARLFAIEDQQGKMDMFLSAVTTTSGNSTYRKYTFSYNGESYRLARLVAIKEANGNGEHFRPVMFSWHSLPSSIVHPSQLEDVQTVDGSGFVEETYRQFFSADLNGDGVGDIIRVSPVKVTTSVLAGGGTYDYYTYVYICKSKVSPTGKITYESPLVYTLPPNMSLDTIKSMFGGVSAMDFDGDGYNDLVFPFQNSATDHWNNAVFHVVLGSDIVAGRSGGARIFTVNLQSTDKAPLFATFDVDGDGRDDIVCVEQHMKDGYYPCTIVQFAGGNTLTRTELRLTLPQGVDKDIEKVFVGDYNNDGLADLMLLYDGGYKIYFNSGADAVASKFSEGKSLHGTDFGNCWRIQQGDFDGDGLSDFVYNKQGDSWLWIAHNNGDGTFSHQQTIDMGVADHASNKDDGRFSLVAYDMDHDGLCDVMVCKAGYRHRGFPEFKNEYTDTQVRWLHSTGSGLELFGSYMTKREDDASESSIFLGDFNGDGYLELANFGGVLNNPNTIFSEKVNIYDTGYDVSQVDKIVSINDGMGNMSFVTYAFTTNPTVYGKSSKSAYPVNVYTLPLSVVSKVTSENGACGSQEAKYFYEDLRLHVAGKGMLGFNAMTMENTTLGTKCVSDVSKWDESLWIPTEVKTSSMVGGNTSSVVSTYSISRMDKNYFAYVSQKNMTDLDGNLTKTITNYDLSRGVVVDEIVKNDGDGMYKKISYSDYQNKSGIWLPAMLTMSQKHKDDPQPHTNVTTYNYDDRGNVLSSTVNSGTNMALTTTSTYDEYGNVLSTVTTGNGVKPMTKYYEYDATGRFMVKSYTSPSSATNTFTYDKWGNILTESDATDPTNILTTRYTYDGFGRKLTVLLADGSQTTYWQDWGTTSDKRYYLRESATGMPSVTIWFDKGGHEVLRESFGARDMPVSKATSYDGKGQISRVENKMGNLTITREFTYDERGRVTMDVLSSGRSISYSYGNRSVVTIDAGHSCAKTYDAWGNITKSTDPANEVEYQYSSVGKPSHVRVSGSTVTLTYDVAGNQLSLSDPDAGTSHFTYSADGKLLTQTDGRGVKTTNSYDGLGRLVSSQVGKNIIAYTYGTTGIENLRLTKLAVGNNVVEYTHDKFGRVITESRNVDGMGTYGFSYIYNTNNQLSKMAYPGGLEVEYQYDDNGFKVQSTIGDKVIYKLEDTDGIESHVSFLGKLTFKQTRDSRGFESYRRVFCGSSILENFDISYDGTTGNLLTRKRNNAPQETFGYDKLDRLTSVKNGETETMRISYAPNGNVLCKTGVGNFLYDGEVRPHAVAEVENTDGQIPSDALNTSFNDFGKIQMIEDLGKNLRMDLEYGPDMERWSSELLRNGVNVRTTVYANDYEKITENGTTREFYYLDGNTIIVKENGTIKSYLAFTDNLGSILSVMDENGKKVFDATYDAWGRQTVTLNSIGLHRGYTGHEMLGEFDIINMNGRLYDPVLGRFLSPDSYVQMPDNSQSFNRYSYCLNNPLKYTDPSGEFWNLVIGAAIGGVFNWASNGFLFNSKGLGYFATGAIAGTVGTGLASGINVALAGGNFWAGATGFANGISSTGFLASAASGASAGFVSGLILGTGNSWVEKHSIGTSLLKGLKSGSIGFVTGGLVDGIIGGFDALEKGTNFLTGMTNISLNEGCTYSEMGADGILDKIKHKTEKIKVKYVGDYEGQHVFESASLGVCSKNGGFSGVTFPDRGIFVGKGVFTGYTEYGRAMMQHEFGHVLQYRIVGFNKYYSVISKESIESCSKNANAHSTFWTETWANYLSKQYFGVIWHGVDTYTFATRLLYYPAKNITQELMKQKFGM